MNVYVTMKSAGKRKRGLEKVPYSVPDGIETLRGLIEAVVRSEAERYNTRGTDNKLVAFLTDAQIEEKAAAGKIGFGRLYSENRADVGKSVEAALQGYEDGLFRVLVNDTEITTLDARLNVNEGDTLTFIRLTFLAGRLW
jgi:hypothetical protein